MAVGFNLVIKIDGIGIIEEIKHKRTISGGMKAHAVGLFDSLIYLEYVFEHFSNINN